MGEKAKSEDSPRQMKITFSELALPGNVNEGIDFLISNHQISVSYMNILTLNACAALKGWGGDQNRTIIVVLGKKFDVHAFFGVLGGKATVERFEFIP